MKRSQIAVAALALLLVVSACATTGEGQRFERNVITYEEIEGRVYDTARDVVDTLRPQWIRGSARIAIYVGDQRMGDTAYLRQIMGNRVQRLEYLEPTDAARRFGIGHEAGAIIVTLR
jgi:hypothetical protein